MSDSATGASASPPTPNDSGATRHIVLATDAAFAIPTAVTLRSISEVDSGPLAVHILVTDCGPDVRDKVESSVLGQGVTVDWIDMDAHVRSDVSRLHGVAALFRLSMAEVLPPEVERVLYLDVDVLVLRSLEPLWSEARDGSIARAVRSVNFPSICTYGAVDNWHSLGLDPRAPYFNSGVLMVELGPWRSSQIGSRAFEYLESPLANGTLADQEALNVVLAGHWTELDPSWNVQPGLLGDQRAAHLLYDDEVIEAARRKPAIIHFIDRPKPWHRDCRHPFTETWRAVASRTAFAPIVLDRTSLRAQASWRVRRAASALFKGR